MKPFHQCQAVITTENLVPLVDLDDVPRCELYGLLRRGSLMFCWLHAQAYDNKQRKEPLEIVEEPVDMSCPICGSDTHHARC